MLYVIGWRYAFWSSIILGAIGIYLRQSLEDSDEFEAIKDNKGCCKICLLLEPHPVHNHANTAVAAFGIPRRRYIHCCIGRSDDRINANRTKWQD